MKTSSVALPMYWGNITIDDAYGGKRAFETILNPLVAEHKGYHLVGIVFDLGGMGIGQLESYPVEIIISDNPEATNPKSFKANVSIAELFRLCKHVEFRIGTGHTIENNVLNPANIEELDAPEE